MTVTFDQLLAGLNAKRSGSQWQARCPAHDDKDPSLSITTLGGRVLLHCFASCEYRAIVEWLELRGLWPVEVAPVEAAQPNAAADRVLGEMDPGLLERMRKIDAKLRRIDNTRVDRYLTNRGIKIRSPHQIAYHPALWHPFTGTSWPAMVAIIRTVEGHVAGLHRTYLTYAKPIGKAPIDPVRLTLGPVLGHAVQLAPAAETLLIGEGIETVLSAMQLYVLPGWAALSAANLVHVILPKVVRKVIILVDDDRAGRREALAAAWRLRREGLRVQLIKPTPDGANDFNDLLQQWG
jgi:putative DNA primase/helicase